VDDPAPVDAESAPVAPSFWRAIGLTFSTCVRHARTCLVLVSVYALLNGVASAIGRTVSFDLDPSRASPGELIAISAAAIAGFGTLVVVNIFVYPPTIGALSLVGSAAVYGDALEVEGIVRRALDRALEAIGAVVLTFLILLVAPVAVGIAGVVIGLAAGAEAGFGAFVVLTVLLLPVVLYVFVRLSLAVPIVMREGVGPIAALRRSWELVRGAWWWVFGVGAIVGLGAGVINGIASTIASLGSSNFVLAAVGSTVGAAISGSAFGVVDGVLYAARAQVKPPPEVPAQVLPQPVQPAAPTAPEPPEPAAWPTDTGDARDQGTSSDPGGSGIPPGR
jgi:hypothetical protein